MNKKNLVFFLFFFFAFISFSFGAEEKINPFKNAKVGDYVKIGRYPQSVKGNIQPIEWRVLAKGENKILVISKYGLEARRFDRKSNKWNNSEIRQWVNKDFYNKAFNENEKKYINSFDGDNVFLLSKEEVEKYFAKRSERRCEATDYARANGADSKYNCDWWLRSSHPKDIDSVYSIDYDEDISGCRVNYDDVVVRPAMWIKF